MHRWKETNESVVLIQITAVSVDPKAHGNGEKET